MLELRFFFVHVMKAAGTSLIAHAADNLGRDRLWYKYSRSYYKACGAMADPVMLDIFIKSEPGMFRYLPGQGVQFFDGHVPFAAASLLGRCDADLHIMTLLRNPVERVASHLMQSHADLAGVPDGEGNSLEALYEQPSWWHAYGNNYQTKLFAMSEEEAFSEREKTARWRLSRDLILLSGFAPTADQRTRAVEEFIRMGNEFMRDTGSYPWDYGSKYLGCQFPQEKPVVIDDVRLRTACDSLEQCRVVGLAEQPELMVEELYARYGWALTRFQRINAGLPARLSPGLRKRIASDNEADFEFYQFARKLVARRLHARRRTHVLL